MHPGFSLPLERFSEQSSGTHFGKCRARLWAWMVEILVI